MLNHRAIAEQLANLANRSSYGDMSGTEVAHTAANALATEGLVHAVLALTEQLGGASPAASEQPLDSVPLDILSNFAAWPSDDEAKTDLELTCTDCGKAVCDIQAEDALDVLARTAAAHVRSGHSEPDDDPRATQQQLLSSAATALGTNDPERRWEAALDGVPIGRWDSSAGAVTGAAVHYEAARLLRPGQAQLVWNSANNERTYTSSRDGHPTGYTVRYVPTTI